MALRVALVLPYASGGSLTPRQHFHAYPHLPRVVEALQALGVSATGYQLWHGRSDQDRIAHAPEVGADEARAVPSVAERGVSVDRDRDALKLERGAPAGWPGPGHHALSPHHPAGIEIVSSPRPIRAFAAGLYRRWPRHGPAYFDPAPALWRRVVMSRPDLIHVLGMDLDVHVAIGASVARALGVPLVVGFHGGTPTADRLTTSVRRASLATAARVLFTARELAEPWLSAGLLRRGQVAEVLETSTDIEPVARAAARYETGVIGTPAVLMASRLEPIKDPLTALTAFAILAERCEGARLYVYALSRVLEEPLRALTGAMPSLTGKVEFREAVERQGMPALLSAADCLLQASRREWSGQVVIEALACGTPPVVTDIPAMRMITGAGRHGRLFKVGDAPGAASAMLELHASRTHARGEARRHFASRLSFQAIAADLLQVYEASIAESVAPRMRR